MKKQNQDWLDAMFKQDHQYIQDNGFTERVLEALPTKRQISLLRNTVLLVSVLVSFGLGFVFLPGGQFLKDAIVSVTQFSLNPFATPLPFLPLAMLIVTLWGAFVLASSET